MNKKKIAKIIDEWARGPLCMNYRRGLKSQYAQIVADVGDNPIWTKETNLTLIDYHDGRTGFMSLDCTIATAIERSAFFGQWHAEWLLENQDHIPEEKGVTEIRFPGTIWRDFFRDPRILPSSPHFFYPILRRPKRKRNSNWEFGMMFCHGATSLGNPGKPRKERIITIIS